LARIASATAVSKRQLWGPLQAQLARELRLKHAVRSGQRVHRRLAFPRRTEDADEHLCVAEVRRGIDAGDGDEPDPRVLQLRQRL
jgi:hypothetical protein